MIFSMNDIYPNSSKSVTTTQETIAENEEREKYTDNTATDTNTGKTYQVDKGGILGAVIVFAGLLILIHFIE